MANFIELLDKNDRNTLINVDNITSVVIYREPHEEVRIYLIGDKESFITVKESYEELKGKLQDWIKINLR
jgi:hypothetical protein